MADLPIEKVIYMKLFQDHSLLFSFCCLTESESFGCYVFKQQRKREFIIGRAMFDEWYILYIYTLSPENYFPVHHLLFSKLFLVICFSNC